MEARQISKDVNFIDFKKPRRKIRSDVSIKISKIRLENMLRGFLIFYIVSSLVLIGLSGFIGFKLGYRFTPLEYTSVATVKVSSGDTLWDLAEEYTDGSADIRKVVDEIMRLNNLVSTNIYYGQELKVPVVDNN